MNQGLSFSFTVDETNVILNALAQQPYIQVVHLIQRIQNEAQAQQQPQPPAVAGELVN